MLFVQKCRSGRVIKFHEQDLQSHLEQSEGMLCSGIRDCKKEREEQHGKQACPFGSGDGSSAAYTRYGNECRSSSCN